MSAAKRRNAILTAAIALGGLAIIVGLPRTGSGGPDPFGLVPYSRMTAKRAPVALPASAQGAIDVLDLIDLEIDTVGGTWGFQERSLVTANNRYGRIQAPVRPPEEYDLRLGVTRRKGTGALVLCFSKLGRPGMIAVDGEDRPTTYLALADSPDLRINETAVTEPLLPRGTRVSLTLSVRKDSVALFVGDRKVIDWRGKPHEMTVAPGYRCPDPNALSLGSYNAAFMLDEVILTPVSGTPTILRSPRSAS